MRINLKNATFIIPVYIESPDRLTNFGITLSYLCKYLDTNIIILEHDTESKVKDALLEIDMGGTSIRHVFSKNDEDNDIFHRTRFLNEMLFMVNTEVVVNYDVDILLMPEEYKKCVNLIVNDGNDLVYPYLWGQSQFQVYYSGRDKIKKSLDLSVIGTDKHDPDTNLTRSEYGHCQFFKTKSYREGGMENEGFVSYAPEDQERGYRFKKLGYKVIWSNAYVYHLEHTRGHNSSSHNPKMTANNDLFEYIKTLSEDELRDYYDNIDYRSKYKKNWFSR